MNKNPLLLEIGCEDLPPEVIAHINEQSAANFTALLIKKRIDYSGLKTYTSHRRISIVVDKISGSQNTLIEKIVGPPCSVAMKDGKITPAGQGFAKKMGMNFKELDIEKTKKGEYYSASKEIKGLKLADILPELIDDYLKSFSFSITMRWPGSSVAFPRPIRWVLIRYGKKNVKIKLPGIPTLRTTRGHRVFADKNIVLEGAGSYLTALKQNYVYVDHDMRMKALNKSIDRALARTGLHAVKPEKLMEEINNSIEYPTAIKGEFPSKYLKMPREIIEACLVYHQKYLPIEDEKGKITNYFIGIRDGISEFLEPIRRGYERVLIARLDDAEFFFEKDRTKNLEAYSEDLKGVEFSRGLGSLYDKITRCRKISKTISTILNLDNDMQKRIDKIIFLSKSDLVTGMVGEFPELEGEIGRIYAKADGEEKIISDSISQHYHPRSYEDVMPRLKEAAVVGLIDRLDSLCGNMGSGVAASGSQDPYGLRRICRGLISIIVAKKWDIDMKALFVISQASYKNQGIEFEKQNMDTLYGFIVTQIKQFLEEHFEYDVVRAVMADKLLNPYQLYSKAKAVQKIKKNKSFEPIIIAFKRINNILKQSADKNIKIPTDYNKKLFKCKAEKFLDKKLLETRVNVSSFFETNNYIEALRILSSVRSEVDEFFEQVLVMDPDKSIMKNRLSLLKATVECFAPIGDISKLEIKSVDKA